MKEKKWNILGCLKIQKMRFHPRGWRWQLMNFSSSFASIVQQSRRRLRLNGGKPQSMFISLHRSHRNRRIPWWTQIFYCCYCCFPSAKWWRMKERMKDKSPWRRCVRFSINFSRPNRWNLWKLTTGSFVWELRFCSLPSSLSLRYVRMPKSKRKWIIKEETENWSRVDTTPFGISAKMCA